MTMEERVRHVRLISIAWPPEIVRFVKSVVVPLSALIVCVCFYVSIDVWRVKRRSVDRLCGVFAVRIINETRARVCTCV